MRSGDNAIDGEFHQLGARSCTLATLVEIASAVGTDFIGMKALELAERAATEPFFVACVGRPDRGKSALINALVETSILPESTTPVNVIVTTLRYGPRRKATVHFADGQRKQIPIRAISDYVTEERNPVNQKAVGAVEVFVPSSLLAAGVCLVDVPGTASLSGGNQASIKALVPHFDAAIVALGVDPPISNDELSVAHEAARHVKHVLFVLNKVDRLSQRAREEAVISLEAILSRHFGRTAKPLFCVSANQSLNDVGGLGVERDERLLKATLVGLARESGAALAQLMEARALASVAPGLVAEIERFNDALVRARERITLPPGEARRDY
jgi:GTP-binding protein EngB required for normal cell division